MSTSHRSRSTVGSVPRTNRVLRGTSLIAIAAFLLVACGQKPGVHIAGPGGGQGGGSGDLNDGGAATTGGFGDETTGDFAAGEGDFGEGGDFGTDGGGGGGGGGGGDLGTDGGGTTTGGGGGGGGTTGGDGGGGGDGGDGGTTGGGGGGNQPQGSDRTGAGPDKIVIGIHAPVTGAAPFPSEAFREGKDLYFNYVTKTRGQKVLGRPEVEVVFRDDKYNPSSAVQACREMAKGENTFLLVGGGGTDQVQACGQWANQNGVPYFSAGVTEKGLRGLPFYFATSMSYKQQGDLLGQLVRKRFGGKKAAMIVTDTPNFADAVQGWEAAVKKYRIPYYKTYRHPKNDESWYDQAALDMSQNGVEVIYPLTSPSDYIKFASRANAQGYRPQYVGVGVTMGLNVVAQYGCDASANAVDGSLYFSPWPGLDWARKNEPAFFEQAQKEKYDSDMDLALALWGLNKDLHAMFQKYGSVYGNDLTREDFRTVIERSKIETGLFPTVSYTPEDHFGASTVHLLEADCSKKQYVTAATFASGF